MKIKAPTFADLFAETSPQLGGARRTKFLETLDRIIPWQDLKSLIGPYYSEGKRGAQPYPLELMIRIHFLQLVYNLSDPMCEETLHDSFACRRFVGLTMDSKCPDVNSRTLSCPRKSSYVPVCQLVKGIYLFK
jgi:IS5 family transposase